MGRPILRRSVQALVIAALLSGCANEAPPPPPPSAAPSPAPAPSPVPAPSTGAMPTPAPPRAAPLPAAADGTNLGACREGRCQIEVRPGTIIPLSSRLGAQNLTILKVTGRGVTYGAARGSNLLGSTGAVGSTNTVQGLSVTVDAVSGDTAVITLRPA